MRIAGHQYSFYGNTKTEAQAKARQARADAERGLSPTAPALTLEAYAVGWLQERRPGLRQATWNAYAGHLENWILPQLGRCRLSDLTPAHVRRLLNDVVAAGRTENTAGHVRATLSAILKAAQQDLGLPRNVASAVPVPTTGAPRFQAEIVSPAEAQAILAAFKGSRLEPLVMFSAATGLRRGELLALAWSDIDLERQLLHVRHSLDAGQLVRPKTTRSARSFPLPRMAQEALALQRRIAAADQLAAGADWTELGLVFPGPTGGLRNADAVGRNFQEHLKRHGLPVIRWHALRRVFAAQLQSQGVSLHLIRDLLGHSQISVTQSYAYTMPDDLTAAMTAIDRAWSAGPPEAPEGPAENEGRMRVRGQDEAAETA